MLQFNLAQAKIGQEHVVSAISESTLSSKLMELGLIPGCKIKVLYTAPFGDPIAIDVSGFTLSLRKDEAALILLES